jgi:energy-converting hydrogenase Eha subunit H
VRHGAGETGGGPYSQTAAEILAAPLERYAALERHLAALLDRLVD